jgi:ABC-2 type transport system permease protein
MSPARPGASPSAPILSLALKDIRLLVRDKTGFFFTFFFPLLMAVFFGVIFSGGGAGENAKLRIAAVDEDGTAGSAAFVARLAADSSLDVVMAPTREAAFEMVRRNEAGRTAYIVLPRGFGSAQERTFSGRTTEILLGVDPSRSAEAGMLEGVLTRHAFERFQSAFSDPGALGEQARLSLETLDQDTSMSPALRPLLRDLLVSVDDFSAGLDAESGADTGAAGSARWEPVRIERSEVRIEESGPRSAFAISFPQGIVWALIGCSMSYVLSIVTERARGTLVRLRVAPISRWQILGGKSLACFLTAAGVSAVLLVIMLALGVRPGSLALLARAVAAASRWVVGLMTCVAAISRPAAAASGLGWAAMLVMAMIGGGMVPLFVMPEWMYRASVVSPVRWTVLALEGAIWRGYSIAEMALPCGVLLAVGAAAFVVGAVAFRTAQEG